MSWMLTATGATVDLRWIGADSISLLDIAHHLAQRVGERRRGLRRQGGASSRALRLLGRLLLLLPLPLPSLGSLHTLRLPL